MIYKKATTKPFIVSRVMELVTDQDNVFLKKRPAIFIDRDGVINHDHGYVAKIDDFHFIAGVINACKELKNKGYLLVLITNQSGIARGYYSEAQFHQLTQWMDWSFSSEGVDFDGVYYCPHHHKYGIGKYKIACNCRKPKPGLIISAAQELRIDLARSFLVGDSITDIQAGISAGLKGNYLVKTGKKITDEGTKLADEIYEDLDQFSRQVKPVSEAMSINKNE
jgi:D-glycero-D-manno-heptose 1,7-bisphosphate phosphatase